MGTGDLFLFFGLFREVEGVGASIGYKRGSVRKHVLFGWLQVGTKLSVGQARNELPWVRYHPHLNREPGPKNTLYLARKRLSLPNIAKRPGAGLFGQYSESLRLTAPGSRTPEEWFLPSWLHPDNRASSLTYHGEPSRWSRTATGVMLEAAARGQEFVLDCDDYPEAYEWIATLLSARVAP